MIPAEAIEAATRAFIEHGRLIPALEAAAPHMAAHEEVMEAGCMECRLCPVIAARFAGHPVGRRYRQLVA